ncbi:protein ligase [Erysipelothrix rhusiopathiae]|uniref:lipoate--protein ligase family protein n=1 Tax=Erysipelothrix rhusiopathiae TaxID=1648 RepID=UPI000DF944E8|nr:protein ligase [Erysipelothrix rhusiopathiae]MCG4436844.1 protein ligase [Erysipelothrix rhusiopathiae]MDE8050718.1 protein ligase [Erysipelothrix rhusiopathiae]MDE8070981.1 protein ligase [Erysipelothrix rhusiopathiae]MDE8117137.1 protein ligase [Erysipelothrix rhusiopathiae]MDE8119657.1 protein ligase [Erysipelothrix rhusiopathiae]
MKGIVIDEIGQVEDAFVSTAIDAYSLKNVAEDEMILHLFQHQGINMGVDDVRMDDFDKGLDFYRTHDLPVTIRNSGGRSIVADEGVLNMSLIFHTSKSMNENYQFYGDFIRDALKPISNEIEIYKVEGAYCPGDTDMSIKGQKFCGTAQRRSGSRTSMVCYISVCGDQLRRGELVRDFYSQCHGDVVSVNPHAMQSLDILTGFALTPRYIGDLLIHALAQYCESVEGRKLEDLDVQGFQEAKDRTREHNRRLLP